MNKLIIKGCRLIDPETKRDEITDVLIEGGRITSIGRDLSSADAKVIEASDKLLIPGVIDLHVHLRDFEQSHKETIATGTVAALNGGVTTLLAMPNTKPPLDNAQAIGEYLKKIEDGAVCDVLIAGAITIGLGGRTLADFTAYKNLGLSFVTDDGFDVNDEPLLEEVYRLAKESDLIVMTHPEIDSIAPNGVMNEGVVSQALKVTGQPNEKEWKAVERGVKLALKTGARAHMTHLSTKESIELVRQAKKDSDLITCDVTPHHYSLTEEEIQTLGGVAKVNPPLRTDLDRQAVLKGIEDGTVDCLVTDHAPHSAEEKNKPLETAAFGFTGLEILVPSAITELHFKLGIPLMRVIDLLTFQPARLAGLPVGRVQEGKLANLALIDLNREKKVSEADFRSMGKVTPFIGKSLKGWPAMTFYKGIAQ